MVTGLRATGRQHRVRACSRQVFIEQEVLLRLSRALLAVVLELGRHGDGIILLEQRAHFAQRTRPLSFRAEQDVKDPLEQEGVENETFMNEDGEG